MDGVMLGQKIAVQVKDLKHIAPGVPLAALALDKHDFFDPHRQGRHCAWHLAPDCRDLH